MDLPLYQYQTLPTEDAIRILALDPANNHGDDLRCSVLIKSRSELLQSTDNRINHYEAVSYAWGIPEFTKVLICDGETIVKITPNVDILLRRLRKRTRVRNLWVDAVCLDQANDYEKAHQVPLMDHIYLQASKVVVWLGDNVHEVKKMFAFIRRLATLHDIDFKQIEHLAETILGPNNPRSALQSFLDLPWFQRRWVLQEASNGRNVMVRCNEDKIAWNWFADGLRSLQRSYSYADTLGVQSQRALSTVRMIQAHAEQSLLSLLWTLDHAKCSNANDRLFALYGLIRRNKDLPPQVNYARAWHHNYMVLAGFNVRAGAGAFMELLRHTIAFGKLSDTDSTRASWVPDWSRPRQKAVGNWTLKSNAIISESVRAVEKDGGIFVLHINCTAVPITHIFTPPSSTLSLGMLSEWLPTSTLPPQTSSDGGASESLWSGYQKQIFEVLCLGISRFLHSSVIAHDQRLALNTSLDYFSGNLTISAESVASKMAILLPCARALLQDFSLFACEHRHQRWFFGIASGPVQLGDQMTLEDKGIRLPDIPSKFDLIIRFETDASGSERVNARMVGVCIHPGRYRQKGHNMEYVLT